MCQFTDWDLHESSVQERQKQQVKKLSHSFWKWFIVETFAELFNELDNKRGEYVKHDLANFSLSLMTTTQFDWSANWLKLKPVTI